MRMTSVMDSSLMRNDDHQMQRSSLMPSMSMYRNMMASDRHNMNNQMSHPMNINMNNMLDGRHGDRQMSDRQMYRNIMMGDNRMDNMMNNRNIMMQEDNMRNNMMSNVMNRNMYNLDNRNMENMNMDDGLLHERNTMAQRMEVERIPENAMTYFYF